jgi:hypothetical protein
MAFRLFGFSIVVLTMYRSTRGVTSVTSGEISEKIARSGRLHANRITSSGAPDDLFCRFIGEATGEGGACAVSATARIATGRDEEMLEQVRSEGAQDGVGLSQPFILIAPTAQYMILSTFSFFPSRV